MPTQSKKTLALTPTDRPAKPKKKKKKDSGKSSRNINTKTPASAADSSSEGTKRVKSRAKSRGLETNNEKKASGDLRSKSRFSNTQNTSLDSWRTSSSDGRSTSSSGENFSAASCANSVSSDDQCRAQGSVNSMGASSATSLTRVNEALRWDYTQCDDPHEEEERLKIYKLHRRKRYMDFLHKRTGGEPQNSFYA